MTYIGSNALEKCAPKWVLPYVFTEHALKVWVSERNFLVVQKGDKVGVRAKEDAYPRQQQPGVCVKKVISYLFCVSLRIP